MKRKQIEIDLGDGRSAIIRVPHSLTRQEYHTLALEICSQSFAVSVLEGYAE